MPNIFEAGGYPRAPQRGRVGLGRRPQRARIRPEVLGNLRPDHPLFQVLPGLRRQVSPESNAQFLGPPGQPVAAGAAPGIMDQPPGSFGMAPIGDLSGLAEEQYGEPGALPPGQTPRPLGERWGQQQAAPIGLRERLLQKMAQAGPNAVPLTSRRAMAHHLQQRQRPGGRPARRPPILPQRRGVQVY